MLSVGGRATINRGNDSADWLTEGATDVDLHFEYFAGPPEEMHGLCEGDRQCALCGQVGLCFELDRALVFEMADEDKEGKVGCAECLRAGRFIFGHGTDLGWLHDEGITRLYASQYPIPDDFPESALEALRRTPQIDTLQGERWLTHCSDFMVYIGTWDTEHFRAHAPDGDPGALYVAMTEYYPRIWDDQRSFDTISWEHWGPRYYAFRCRHCGALRGNWDCD